MERWKHSLFPLLTCLTAAVLALLPPRLSGWKDGLQAGVVQHEAQPSGSNFPASPPELPERIRLLAQSRYGLEDLTAIEQLLEEPEALAEAAALMNAERKALTEAGVLPAAQPEFGENFTAARLYLRDSRNLSSAGFLLIHTSDKYDYDLSMTLDLETGRTLSFRMTGPQINGGEIPPEAMGARFLERLAAAAALEDAGEEAAISWRLWEDFSIEERLSRDWAVFQLKDLPVHYSILTSPRLIELVPEWQEEPSGTDRSAK